MKYDFGYAAKAIPLLLQGAIVTLEVALASILLGTVVGLLLTLIRSGGSRVLSGAVALYISFARGTPLFIQILLVYYGLPAVGLDLPKFAAGVLALSLNGGAYISEMIRGALSAIAPGQIEAARAFGFSKAKIWTRIKLPQIGMYVLPPITVEFVVLLKASSLLSVIAITELTRTAQGVISDSFRPLEILVLAGAIYFVLCFGITQMARYLEQKTLAWRAA
jgi:polar amino acid transport system permease protein